MLKIKIIIIKIIEIINVMLCLLKPSLGYFSFIFFKPGVNSLIEQSGEPRLK